MCTNSGWVSLSGGSPSGGGSWYTTKREEYRQPTNDIRLEKYITPWAPPTSEVRGPIATETRIWARKYWQLSREMSTPIPRLVPSSDEPQNWGTDAETFQLMINQCGPTQSNTALKESFDIWGKCFFTFLLKVREDWSHSTDLWWNLTTFIYLSCVLKYNFWRTCTFLECFHFLLLYMSILKANILYYFIDHLINITQILIITKMLNIASDDTPDWSVTA